MGVLRLSTFAKVELVQMTGGETDFVMSSGTIFSFLFIIIIIIIIFYCNSWIVSRDFIIPVTGSGLDKEWQ